MIVKEKELLGLVNRGSNPNPVLASHVTWLSHLICTTPPTPRTVPAPSPLPTVPATRSWHPYPLPPNPEP